MSKAKTIISLLLIVTMMIGLVPVQEAFAHTHTRDYGPSINGSHVAGKGHEIFYICGTEGAYV
ncbi:MAG: hypothetical protein FWG31_09720, partial [Oscillospiraceae bacterium]|nr:hypothetical protein [Oscillospiraceae bacterium]